MPFALYLPKPGHCYGEEVSRPAASFVVRMEGWRQWQLGRRNTLSNEKTKEPTLTPTGLLMEGDLHSVESRT
jgi:hypothetical protein